MTVRADYDPKYFRRFILISIGCLLFTGWCFYDALVKYPAELERAEVYWKETGNEADPYDGMERDEWLAVVQKNDWPAEAPRKPDKMKVNIQRQYMYAAICILIAIPCLYKWLTARGTWVEADGKKLTTSWGTSFGFKDIESIDKSKWEKKGITKIQYAADGGSKTFVFDDFKYDRSSMSEILSSIEDGLKDSQITGADREKKIQKRKAEEKRLAAERLEAERQRVREQEGDQSA